MIDVELQIASHIKTLPHPSQIKEWVENALWNEVESAEITIRIVDEPESAELNERFRHKSGPTNVLSFTYSLQSNLDIDLLGDIIICAPIIEAEAAQYNKPLLAHWAHIVVHGLLHLLGYDHQSEQEAETMEGLETDILVRMGFPPPYGDTFV